LKFHKELENYKNAINQFNFDSSEKSTCRIYLAEMNVPMWMNYSEFSSSVEKLEEDEDFKKQFCCCLSDFDHVLANPVVLETCFGNSCKKCCESYKDQNAFCYHCNKEHVIAFKKANFTKKTEIKSNRLNDSVTFTNKKYDELMKQVDKKMLKNEIAGALEKTRSSIENSVHSIILNLKKNQQKLETDLEAFKETIQKYI
jgi:hypothetical protein